ncbi:hypothetical protein ACWGDX_27985 [Streptomyces sp. NPDC055025]
MTLADPGWERIEGLPTTSTVRRELVNHPEAGSYASGVTFSAATAVSSSVLT